MVAMPHYGIILAGGRSSRMGTDKALLAVGGEPLLRRIAGRMLEAGIKKVIVSVGDGKQETEYRAALDEFGECAKFAADAFPDCGPLAGLHAGLSAVPAPGYVFAMACDMPVVSESLLVRMAEKAGTAEGGPDAVHAEGQAFHALYHTRAAETIRQRLERGDLRVLQLLDELKSVLVRPERTEEKAFLNLNNPEMYASFTSRL